MLLPVEGFATYRLIVRFPKPGKIYGLYIEGEGTAYKLWVDGELLASNGRVADNPQDMVPQSKPTVVFFSPKDDSTEFLIQFSNYNHRKAGFRNVIYIALPEQIYSHQRNLVAWDVFFGGIYLVMGIYHGFIYGFRPSNKSTLYFAIACFLAFIRKGFLDAKIFILIFPNFSWTTALRIEYFTFFWTLPIFALFIQSLYPEKFSKKFTRTTIFLAAVFTLYMFFVSTIDLSYTSTTYQGIIIISIIYLVYFFAGLIKDKNEDSYYITAAAVILFTGVIFEILYLQNIITTRINGTAAFMSIVLMQAVLLSSRLSKSYSRVEILSKELETTNNHLRQSEIKYRTIFEESKDMIFIASINEQIKEANPATEDILGYTQDELRQMKLSDLLLYEQDREKIETVLLRQETAKDIELDVQRKDGQVIHTLVTLTMRRDESGNLTEFQGNVHDISSRIQAESQKNRAMEFEKLAITDPLTHVYNRRIFNEIATKEWTRAVRNKSTFSIVLLDIDHFKKINDTYGHAVGDEVLIHLTKICLANTRSMDIFARYGGEEFVILMPDTDKNSAIESMERLRKVIQKTVMVKNNGKDIYITASMGIADLNPQEPQDMQLLVEQADHALYTSKESGRNQVKVWNFAG